MAHGFLTPTSVSGDNFWKNAKYLFDKLRELKKKKAPPEEVVPAVVSELQNALPPGKQKLLSPGAQKLLSGSNQKALTGSKPANMLQGAPVAKMLGSGKSEITIKQQLALPPGGPKLPPAGGSPGTPNTSSGTKGGSFVNMPGVAAAPKKLDADAFFKAAQTGVHPETGQYLSSDERKEYLKKSKSKLNAPASTASAGIAGAGSATSLSLVTKGEELTVEAIQKMNDNFTKVVTNLVDATKEQTKQQKQVGEKATAVAEKSSARSLAAAKERDLEQGKDLSSSITPTYGTDTGKLGGAAAGGGLLAMGANALSGKVASKAAGKFGVKQAEKFGVKAAGGAAAKMLGKKIPILGLGLGGIFAAQRAFAGDFTGAGMELASGAASTIPGLGTAGSFGIDAALAARDAGVTPFATGGIISEPTLSLMGEGSKKEGVFPLEGKEGEKTFEKFGEGIIDAQKKHKTDYSKIQSQGLKQYYENEGYGEKLSTDIGEKTGAKLEKLDWQKMFGWAGIFGGNGNDQQNNQQQNASGNVQSPADYLNNYSGPAAGSKDVMTLAAIASLESGSAQGRADVAQSVYNRLRDKTYKGKSIHELLTRDSQYQPAFVNPNATSGEGTRVAKEFKNIQTEDDAVKAIQSYYKKRGQSVSDATARKMVRETLAAIQNPELQRKAAEHVGGRTDFLGYDAGLNAQVTRGGATNNYFGAQYGNKQQNLRLGAAAVPEGLFRGASSPSLAGAAPSGQTLMTKGAGTFIQGNTGNSRGDHFHIGPDEYRLGGKRTQKGLKDARDTAFKVAKGLMAKGTPFTFSNYHGFNSMWFKGKGDKKSDEQVRNAVAAEQAAHANRAGGGSWGGIDIAAPAGTRLPLAVGNVVDKGDGFGNAATVSGTQGFVAHGASGSRATKQNEIVAIQPGPTPEGQSLAAAAKPATPGSSVANQIAAVSSQVAQGAVKAGSTVINNITNMATGGGGGGSGTGVSAGPSSGSIIPSWKTMFSLARR